MHLARHPTTAVKTGFGFATLGVLVCFLTEVLIVACAAGEWAVPHRVNLWLVAQWRQAVDALEKYHEALETKAKELGEELAARRFQSNTSSSGYEASTLHPRSFALGGAPDLPKAAPDVKKDKDDVTAEEIQKYQSAAKALQWLNQNLEARINQLESELDKFETQKSTANPGPSP